MSIAERINAQIQALPEHMQAEVLDFVEYLSHKFRQEDLDWSELSMRCALRGMEDEEGPEYSEDDCTEMWR